MNRNSMHWITALIVALAALVTACTPAVRAADAPPVDLDGTSWILVRIDGQVVRADAEATLSFLDGKVQGIGSCNGFFGPYERDGERLSFGLLASTMMACPDMDLETSYLAALSSVAAYRVEGAELVLANDAGETVLVFAPRTDTPLQGTVWQLTDLNTGTALVSVLEGTTITATVVDGKIGGSAGCNTYFAAIAADGDRWTIGPAGSTEMYCAAPAGIMEQEQAYLSALARVDDLEIEGDVLTLSSADGARLLTFVALEG